MEKWNWMESSFSSWICYFSYLKERVFFVPWKGKGLKAWSSTRNECWWNYFGSWYLREYRGTQNIYWMTHVHLKNTNYKFGMFIEVDLRKSGLWYFQFCDSILSVRWWYIIAIAVMLFDVTFQERTFCC